MISPKGGTPVEDWFGWFGSFGHHLGRGTGASFFPSGV